MRVLRTLLRMRIGELLRNSYRFKFAHIVAPPIHWTMGLLTVVGFVLIVVILSIYLLLVMRRKTTVVHFIDAPDPDNPAATMGDTF